MYDNQCFNDKVLSTIMRLVEQILNARSLTAVSDDAKDLRALTTNHFLLGQKNASAPVMPSSERYLELRKPFKKDLANFDMMWNRWTREYLPQSNQISKWSKEHIENLKEGKWEWLVDNSVERCEYKFGRILEIFTAIDSVVRSARVNTAHGELNRPVVRFAPVF